MEFKTCFEILYNFCLKYFICLEELSQVWTKLYNILHVEYRYSCQILMKLDFLIGFSENLQI